MHPQLAASLLGQPLPPQPGESGEGAGDQAVECQHDYSCIYGGGGDLWSNCDHCGGLLRLTMPDALKWRTLSAVAGRMFRR